MLTTIITYYLLAINLLTFAAYGYDKWKAKRNAAKASQNNTTNPSLRNASKASQHGNRQYNTNKASQQTNRQHTPAHRNSRQHALAHRNNRQAPVSEHRNRHQAQAARQRHRTPEATLLLLAALGGSPGALIAMHLFHHKTLHKKFTIGVPLLLLLQVALAIALPLLQTK